MSETMTSQRVALTCAPAAAFGSLPAMGRVMTVVRGGTAATHERIGPVETVTEKNGAFLLGGAAHDLRVTAAAIHRVVVDRSGRMRDRPLPRLEIEDAFGEVLFSVVALGGIEAFDAAVAPLGQGQPLPARKRPSAPPSAPDEGIATEDAGQAFLEQVFAAGAPVTISLATPHAVQRWTGTLVAPRLAMGFVNLIDTSFHLHLRGGSVASWRKDAAGAWLACDEAGAGFGLSVDMRGGA